jgi:hypothetical protein
MKKEIAVSKEKKESHIRINDLLFQWMEVQTEGVVITMPSNTGRQENEILRQIYRTRSKIRLKTFDKFLEKEQIEIYDPVGGVWEHHRGDIFKITKTPPSNTALWLDLMGGLTNNAENGIKKHVKRFGDDNLLFLTAAIAGTMRAFNEENAVIALMYSTSNWSREMVTNLRLCEILVNATDKKVTCVMDPYIYRRPGSKTTFGVFGYRLTTKTKKPATV